MADRDLGALSIDPKARDHRHPRWLVPALGAVALVVVALFAWWLLGSTRAVEVKVATARTAGAGPAAVLNASGYVTPRLRATVSSKITGKVVEVLVEEGDRVESGQVLAHLDDTDAVVELQAAEAERAVAQAQVVQLEVDLADSRRTLGRITGLHGDGVASQESFDQATTRVESAAAGIELARRQVVAAERRAAVAGRLVENCVVRAPFTGVVVSKDAQPGEMVSPVSAGGGYTRTGIATIVDMASLEVEVDVNESYIARVDAGQPVEAVLDAYPDWRIPARVIAVIPTADRQKATVRVRIAFERLDPRILPDMGVRVSFLEERQDAAAGPGVVVPRGAVRDEDGKSVVLVVAGEVAERRAVAVGRVRGDEVELEAGVRDGERVVVEGPAELEDGDRVRVRTER
jgi:RND family efflux transporter MFP subunit